jgi:phosphoglycolate phosphatase
VSEALALYESKYDVTYAHVDGCYPGVRESVLELHKMGHTLAVLSNKQDSYTKKIVELLFPEKVFSFVQGQTDLPRKPDPTVPRMIMDALGFAPQSTVFVGDSDVDMITAHNAGMMAVGCAWGYRGEADLLSAGADLLLRQGSELSSL